MFEQFDVPAFYLCQAPVASLFSTGRDSGIVLDIGDGTTKISPIFEGYSLFHETKKFDLGGQDLSKYLK